MNSQEIRDALKPMYVFAPALLKAAEIVEAAEQAEKRLAATEKEIDALKAQIPDVEAAKAKALKQVSDFKVNIIDLTVQHEKQRDDIRKATQAMAAQYDEAKAKLAATDKELADKLAAAQREVDDVRMQRDKMKAEIERLRKQFAA